MNKAVDVPRSPFKILIACPSGLSQSQVSIAFSQTYDRIPHPDSSLEDSISEIWNQRLQKNSSLFNGKKFRYGGFTLHSEGGSSNEDSHVCLQLGLTDYRTFVGTNLSPLWERFLVPAEDDSIYCQHFSSPLGNGAIVETSDGNIVLLLRSNNVGEFPGHFVFPGGHPEPQELGIDSHDHVKGFADSNIINGKLSREMFDSIIREVVEEIGVPSESLELYTSAQDGYESTQLYTVPLIDIENMTSKMPGCHHGGFFLYKLMLQAAKDNNITAD